MPRVVIVGGGVVGWSVAYHLLERDRAAKVSVLERHPSFAMESTGRAAGGVRAQFGSAVNIDMSMYSIRFFESFLQSTDVEVSFRQYGYMFVTASAAGADSLAKVRKLQESRGVEVQELDSRASISRLVPQLNCDDLITGTYAPSDGYLDPYSVCQGFERAARKRGANACYGHEVVGLRGDKVSCKFGDAQRAFDADVVVLCCGHLSPAIASIAGIELPIVAEKHQLAMTESAGDLPERLPMVVDFDTSFHFRREGRGLLIGWNDSAMPLDPTSHEPTFDFGFLERLAPIALHRLPLLEQIGFDTKRSWAGFYAETPDKHAIIGEVGDFFVATGFGGHGIMHSPAAGLATAEMILDGAATSIDIAALDPGRFARGEHVVEQMVI